MRILWHAPLGTRLLQRGHGLPLERLVFHKGEVIQSLYRADLRAGAQAIQTHTFQALAWERSPQKLFDLGVRAARLAVTLGPQAVHGILGPLRLEDRFEFKAVVRAYEALLLGMIQGGIDQVLWETLIIRDDWTLKAMFNATQQAFEKSKALPLIVSWTPLLSRPSRKDRTWLQKWWHCLQSFDIESIGLNCGWGISNLKPWIEAMATLVRGATLIHAYPNVSPELSPEDFSRQMQEIGPWVQSWGVCCGGDERHLRALDAISSPV